MRNFYFNCVPIPIHIMSMSFFDRREKPVAVDKAERESKLPWVEKQYASLFCILFDIVCLFILFSRPKTVDEVAYQDEVTKTLKKSIETNNVSLFYFLAL